MCTYIGIKSDAMQFDARLRLSLGKIPSAAHPRRSNFNYKALLSTAFGAKWCDGIK